MSRNDKWIDESIAAALDAIGLMDVGTMKPYDWFQFHPLFAKEWLQRVEELIEKIEEQKIQIGNIASAFPTSSTLRLTNLYFDMLDAKCARLAKEDRIRIASFFNEVLKRKYSEDIYSYHGKALVLGKKEAETLSEKIPFNDGSIEQGRLLGRIYAGAYNFSNGLYLDYYTDYCAEYEGPYDVSKKFGKGSILVVRNFCDLLPKALWDSVKAPCKELKIFGVYNNVGFKTDFIAVHGVFEGNAVSGLKNWAVQVDGEFVSDTSKLEKIGAELAVLAGKQWERLNSQDFETIKQTGAKVRCYTLKALFDMAKMDWKPTKEIVEAVKGKQFATKEYWGIPENQKKAREYWKKILDPRLNFYPGESGRAF